MSASQAALTKNLMVPHPGGMGQPRQSSRVSSRRRGGNSSPLLGGAGVFTASSLPSQQQKMQIPIQSQPAKAPSPTAQSFPIALPKPIPHQEYTPTPKLSPPRQSTQPQRLPPAPSAGSSQSLDSVPSLDYRHPGSTNSISTAASTSSRALKTPQSKIKSDYPAPASNPPSSNDSLASHTHNNDSPSPSAPFRNAKGSGLTLSSGSAVLQEERKSSDRIRMMRSIPSPPAQRAPSPALVTSPLPPTPTSVSSSAGREKPKPLAIKTQTRRRNSPPPPLQLKEKRLSQDWVQVVAPIDFSKPEPKRAVNPPPQQSQPKQMEIRRLPPAMMVPMKSGPSEQGSPSRPRFDRTMTAPPLSPTGPPQAVRPRGSLDQLRNSSPTPRGRHTSISTPPAATLDAQSSNPRLGLWRTGSAGTGPSPPALITRRSEDLLRPSPATKELTKKEMKALQKEQQRSLGVAASESQSEDRKTSGLSMKKSSGALKALFKRGANGKGKEKEDTPPMPSSEFTSQPRTSEASRRPSSSYEQFYPSARPSFSRPRTAGSPSLSPSPASQRPENERDGVSSEQVPAGRSSMSSQRTLYPSPPNLQRTTSQGSRPSLEAVVPTFTRRPSMEERSLSGSSIHRPPSRVLPALPPPSPIPPAELTVAPSPNLSTASATPPLATLPYLQNVSPEYPSQLSKNAQSRPLLVDSPSPASSGSTTRPISPENDIFSIKPSRSLHLLQLPEMDLSLDMTFDRIGLSPSTPRKRSPRKSPVSPGGHSPSRSLSVRQAPSPKAMVGHNERRRSQSFDGLGAMPMDTWRTHGNGGLFANTSSSAPLLSTPSPPRILTYPETTTKPVATQPMILQGHAHNNSYSSQPSNPPSFDHARTPSNASSTNETPSPSPPRTPRDERSHTGFGFEDPSSVPMGLSSSLGSDSGSSVTTPTPAGVGMEKLGQFQQAIDQKAIVLNQPPTIPLPALPLKGLEPAAVIEKVEDKKKVAKPRVNVRILQTRSKIVVPDAGVSLKAIGREVQRLLYAFRYPSQNVTSAERVSLIRTELLTCMVEIEKRSFDIRDEANNRTIREVLFEWADIFLNELRVEQPANERGACLEGLAAVVECCLLSEAAMEGSLDHQQRFTKLMIDTMGFVMNKLGAKGVFHNTLLFSGRFLAFAFFRIPHVGEQLVTVLQLPRGALMRFTKAAMTGPAVPSHVVPQYPQHLLPLCFDDSVTYAHRLANLCAIFNSDEEKDAFLFQPGNWLRRWQSDDSELFPAFYRAYHRQLATYLSPLVAHYEEQGVPIPAAAVLRAPGYAHLATIFAKKCHSYILGSINAVTTSSSTQSFDATESAGLRGSAKPAVLETANRRLVETLSTFANSRVFVPVRGSENVRVIECDGSLLWGDMVDVWAKALISKTSLYAPKGVFSLFDLLDGIVDPPFERVMHPETSITQPIYQSLLDIPYLIHVIRMVLTEGEHALTLVKVIAFVFTHWEVLCTRPEDRRELCLELLLNKKLFERLLLFWSQSVRSYVLRLVVFRLGHLHTTKEDGAASEVEIETVQLLQTRLARIKQRHDELEPRPASEAGEDEVLTAVEEPAPTDEGMPRSRSTIHMVGNDSPRIGSAPNKAERLLGLGVGAETSRGMISQEDDGTSIGKATNWLKKSFGKQKKRKDGSDWSPPPASGSPGDSGSPSIKSGPAQKLGNPLTVGTTPGILRVGGLPSPSLQSPASWKTVSSETESGGSVSPITSVPAGLAVTPTPDRKAKPANLKTPIPFDTVPPAQKSPTTIAFEFELPTMSPRSDTFDPTPTTASSSSSITEKRTSQPPSPRQPASPHMSRSFSKRSSLLPPPTATALEGIMESQAHTPRIERVDEEEGKGYEPRLHAYAIRMLAELEDAQKEYDEWWAEGGIGKMDGAPPRLTVAWPFHEGED